MVKRMCSHSQAWRYAVILVKVQLSCYILTWHRKYTFGVKLGNPEANELLNRMWPQLSGPLLSSERGRKGHIVDQMNLDNIGIPLKLFCNETRFKWSPEGYTFKSIPDLDTASLDRRGKDRKETRTSSSLLERVWTLADLREYVHTVAWVHAYTEAHPEPGNIVDVTFDRIAEALGGRDKTVLVDWPFNIVMAKKI